MALTVMSSGRAADGSKPENFWNSYGKMLALLRPEGIYIKIAEPILMGKSDEIITSNLGGRMR